MSPVSRVKRQILRFAQAIAYVIFACLGLISLIRRSILRIPPLAPDTVRRILVIRLDLLGDVVMSMTAVEALAEAYPKAQITFMCVPYTRAVPDAHPDVDKVIALDVNRLRSFKAWRHWESFAEWIKVYRELRRDRYDLCVSLFGLLGAMIAFASGATHRVGYREESYPFLFTIELPSRRYKKIQHEVLYCLNLAYAAGAGVASLGRRPHLSVGLDVAQEADTVLRTHGVQPTTRYVVIHATAVNGRAKRWPPGHWAGVADRLQDELGIRVVLTGSPGDMPVTQQLVRAMTTDPVVLVGQTTIPQLAAVLQRALVVLSGDSGPLHMAVALNRSSVSVYGPTDPRLCGPYPYPRTSEDTAAPAIVLRTGIFCSPCYNLLATAECRYNNPVCMSEVSVDSVFQAVVSILRQTAPDLLPRQMSTGGSVPLPIHSGPTQAR